MCACKDKEEEESRWGCHKNKEAPTMANFEPSEGAQAALDAPLA